MTELLIKVLAGLFVFFVLLVILDVIKRRLPWPYVPKQVLTKTEQKLFHRLLMALPGYYVFPQVQLSQVLGIKKGWNFHRWFSHISRMSLDFVVCAKDFSVVAVIELDDPTHERADRIRSDRKKNKALADGGVRLIRWKVESMPDVAKIKEVLAVGTN